MQQNCKKGLCLAFLFSAMFLTGWEIAGMRSRQTKETAAVAYEAGNWGLGFGAEGTQPTGNATSAELAQYDAHYVGDPSGKVLYLTFDCGYENGNTEPILDALKKHQAPATFFVVGHFLESAPEIAKRMVAEGHTVGNHTYHHPDMSSIADLTAFQKEMDDNAALFSEVTGQKMANYYNIKAEITSGLPSCRMRSLAPFPYIRTVLFSRSISDGRREHNSEIRIPVANNNSITAISRRQHLN